MQAKPQDKIRNLKAFIRAYPKTKYAPKVLSRPYGMKYMGKDKQVWSNPLLAEKLLEAAQRG